MKLALKFLAGLLVCAVCYLAGTGNLTLEALQSLFEDPVLLDGESVDSNSARMRVLLALGSQETGLTVDEYRQSVKDGARSQRLADTAIPKFKEAIKNNNPALLADALDDMQGVDIGKHFPSIYTELIASSNIALFDKTLEARLPCSIDSTAGSNALEAAANNSDGLFLQSLINAGCDMPAKASHYNRTPLVIALSKHPERLLQYPSAKRTMDSIHRAFPSVLQTGSEEQIREFIKIGASININQPSYKESPLYTVLSRGFDTLAVWMINSGAEVNLRKPHSKKTLLLAFEKGYSSVYEAILTRNRTIAKQAYVGNSLLSQVMQIENSATRFKAIKYLQQQGIPLANDYTSHVLRLHKAIQDQDVELASLILAEGTRVGIVSRHRGREDVLHHATDALEEPNKSIFQNLLQSHGWTTRLARQKSLSEAMANCSIGKKIPDADEAIFSSKRDSDSQRKINQQDSKLSVHRCIASLNSCMENGYGADDCVKTVTTCSTSSQAGENNSCCTEAVKKDYELSRCAGRGAIDTLQYFASSYYKSKQQD